MFKKNFKMKRAFKMITVLAMVVLMSTATFAATDTAVTVTGDTLSGGDITFSDFSAITLDGASNTASATWAIADMIDATGTGDGWNLSLELTQLTEWETDAYVTVDAQVLPDSSINVTTAPIVTLVDETSSLANTITPVATATALDIATPINLLSAAVDGGMGSYAITDITATLTTRADAYAATYKTDATVSIVTGP